MNRPVCRAEADYNFLQLEFNAPYRDNLRLRRYYKRQARRARRRALRVAIRATT